MFAFLLLFAASVTEKPVEEKQKKETLPAENVDSKVEEDDEDDDKKHPIEKQLEDVINAINTTELFDSLDEKVDEILDNLRSEAKVFQKKALKEVKRGTKRLAKKLKHIFHKKHHN